jgi:hypothetical protein
VGSEVVAGASGGAVVAAVAAPVEVAADSNSTASTGVMLQP